MLIPAAICVGAIYVFGHWVAGLALAVLFITWRLLRPSEGPPVLALALTFQWTQITLGIFYAPLSGEVLATLVDVDWLPMVLIGLGCVLSLAVGLRFGQNLIQRKMEPLEVRPREAFSLPVLFAAYVILVATTGTVQEFAFNNPALTQAVLALSFSHLALLFLLLRRFAQPTFQWKYILGLLALEVGLGFTGYFAGFREPLIMAFIMVTEIFDRREPRHWALMAGVIIVLSGSSYVWMSVRTQYRQDFADELESASRSERLQRVRSLAGGIRGQEASDFDETSRELVERVWAIYYPARAIARVPSVLPYTDGAIIGAALRHLVTPRILFPDKPDLPSDSEMVRKYSDVEVAGAEQGTSIAFGYAGESYIDFGVPLMFIPTLLYGFFVGMAYQVVLFRIQHRDLAIGVITVIFWLSLYLFERSWVKTLGLHISLLVYLGGVTYLLDRYLIGRREKMLAPLPSGPLPTPSR